MLENLSDDYKLKLKAILKHFGEDAQYKKLFEEMKELRDEFEKVFITRLFGIWEISSEIVESDNFIEEIADCYIVAYQLNETNFINSFIDILFFYHCVIKSETVKTITHEIFQKRILEIARFKIDRTIQRYSIVPEGCGIDDR